MVVVSKSHIILWNLEAVLLESACHTVQGMEYHIHSTAPDTDAVVLCSVAQLLKESVELQDSEPLAAFRNFPERNDPGHSGLAHTLNAAEDSFLLECLDESFCVPFAVLADEESLDLFFCSAHNKNCYMVNKWPGSTPSVMLPVVQM